MYLLVGGCGAIAFEDIKMVGFNYKHIVDFEFLVVDVDVKT